ncbi:very-long-chain enoyl-CoA reductase-like isoform X1 [Iris pallida]|uniref:Very-long-chain enoyl-CoA reductase-like isoform X1 n=1 Tax=Iris pallida TaxID=29817 RepID=A0AAX6FSX7_IRIPA|nr:very-long-chain enoyl-CoA reductase-like isoform X1 [Iris pallida]
MAATTILNFLFPPPPSLLVNAMSVISACSLALIGLSEALGRHLNYSKFWNVNPPTGSKGWWRGTTLSSRAGMLLLYAPAAAAAAASFFVPGAVVGARAQLLCAALAVHFFKRLFEVLFIHQYSGRMLLGSAIPITFSYTVSTVSMIYAQYLSRDMAEPAVNLEYAGIVLFLIGIAGNFYHHYLLSKLRQKGDKGYKIPRGGLFELVLCPHYLFEIIGFYGVAMIAQTIYSVSFALGTTFYLVGRSAATRKWYLSKFENFPREVKALVPYIF